MKLTIPKTSFFIRFWKLCLFKRLKHQKSVPPSSNLPDSDRRSKKTLLWLDDRLNPNDPRMDWLAYSPVGREVEVIWIKNFYEFRNWIELNGLPDGICFDHDLGIDTPSGLACAEWLIQYCQSRSLKLPSWSSQSTNPEKKARINRLLNNFLKQSQKA